MTKQEKNFLEKYNYSFESLSKIFYTSYYLEKYKDYIYEESIFKEENFNGIMGILFAMKAILKYKEYFNSLVEIEIAVAIIDMQIVLNVVSHKEARQLRKTIETFFGKIQIDFEENFDRERTQREIEEFLLNYYEESFITETLEKMLLTQKNKIIEGE